MKQWLSVAVVTVGMALMATCARGGGVEPVTDGLVLWLRGDAGVQLHPDGALAVWQDQSGRGRHVAPVDRATVETVDFGDGVRHPVVALRPETDGLLTDEAHAWGEALTAFVVFRFNPADGGANGARLLDASNSRRFLIARSGTDYAFTVRGRRMPTLGPCAGDWDLVAAVYNGAEGRLTVNGAYGEVGTADPPQASAGQLGIGRRHLGGNQIGGWFAEVLLYDRALTAAERNQVGWYLARKYKLQTAHGDPATPRVTTQPAAITTPTSATLKGLLACAGLGAENVEASVYWGLGADAGTDAAVWAQSHHLGTFAADSLPMSLSHPVEGLSPGRQYTFRFLIRGERGDVWGDPLAFTPYDPNDWPMWRYNAARTGQSPAIDALADTLHLQWVRELPAPRRAWAQQFDDGDKLEFDLSYTPVAMGGRLFVGSMTTDSLTAYTVDTGEVLWRFYADGPIRVAPVAWNGRVYVPSDDGHLYCLDAETGALLWSFDARPSDHRVLGNERVISMWPVRGGPLVMDGTVYFASGIWPFLGASLYALDAETGTRIWENTGFASEWQSQPHGGAYAFSGLAPQGYLAAADDRLVVSGGRASPGIFNRHDGTLLHHRMQYSKGSGGYRVKIRDGLIFNHGARLRLDTGAGAGGGTPDVPEWDRLQARVEAVRDRIDGEIFESFAAWDRLFVVTRGGRLYAFGADPVDTPVVHAERPAAPAAADTDAGQLAATILSQTGIEDGYALVLGAGDGALLEQLAARSRLHIVALESDPARVEALRRQLDQAGLYGTRIAIVQGTFTQTHYPAYITSLLVAVDPTAAGLSADAETFARIETRLRPYSGRAWLGFDPSSADVRAAARAFQPEAARLTAGPLSVVMLREGPLPETGQWTHQHADAAQSVLSRDFRVRPPFGPIWFGGPSHDNVLPRHAAGPRPHVAGGRLVVLGVETISARCVYTGRELWVREFPGIGHPFTNLELEARWQEGRAVYMTNQPGATYIGSPYVSLSDAIYLRYERRIIRLDPDTGATVAEWELPVRPASRLASDAEAPDWGHISVAGGIVITTTNPHIFRGGELGSRGDDSWDGSSSERLVALDRHTGEVAWIRDAVIGFRHNAIVSSGDRVFVNDLLTEHVIAMAVRRGLDIAERPRLTALDIRSGDVLWSQESEVFGTFLSYSTEHDILIEGATHDGRMRIRGEPGGRMIARNGRSGETLWERSGGYSGPVILRDDRIIPGRPGGGICLLTGGDVHHEHPVTGEPETWSYWKTYGCGSANASPHLLLFRSGAAGYTDLEHDGGTGMLGGFRAGCTANMIAADGVLNAPDYTRTCTCSYQNQTSLGLIHMPEMEMWTVNRRIANVDAPIRRLGVNLGAPGDRRAEDGTFWMHAPVEAPSLTLDVLTLQSQFARDGEPRIVGLDGPVAGQTRDHAPEKAVDGDAGTQWRLSCNRRGDYEQAGLTFTLDHAVTLDRVALTWWGPTETEYFIAVRSPDNEWVTVHAGVGEGNRREAVTYTFDPVSTHQVRIGFGAHGNASEDSRGRRLAHDVSVAQVRLGDLPFPSAYAYFQPQPIFRMNPLGVEADAGWRWVGASGLRDIGGFALRNIGGHGDTFTLRLHFCEPDALDAGQRRFDIRLGDRVLARDFDIVAAAGGVRRTIVLSVAEVLVEDDLRLSFVAADGSEFPPVLSGVELVRVE